MLTVLFSGNKNQTALGKFKETISYYTVGMIKILIKALLSWIWIWTLACLIPTAWVHHTANEI